MTARIEKTVFINCRHNKFPHTQTSSSAHHPPDDEPSGYFYKIGKAD